MRVFNNNFIQPQPIEIIKKPEYMVKLKCQTVLDFAIKYCDFKSPSGKWHSISDDTPIVSDSRISYWGQGFDMGECGITIKDLADDDYGEWICSIQLIVEFSSNDGVPQTASIMLHHPESHATAIGLGVAIGIIMLSVVVFMVFRVRRALIRKREIRNEQQIVQMSVAEDN